MTTKRDKKKDEPKATDRPPGKRKPRDLDVKGEAEAIKGGRTVLTPGGKTGDGG